MCFMGGGMRWNVYNWSAVSCKRSLLTQQAGNQINTNEWIVGPGWWVERGRVAEGRKQALLGWQTHWQNQSWAWTGNTRSTHEPRQVNGPSGKYWRDGGRRGWAGNAQVRVRLHTGHKREGRGLKRRKKEQSRDPDMQFLKYHKKYSLYNSLFCAASFAVIYGLLTAVASRVWRSHKVFTVRSGTLRILYADGQEGCFEQQSSDFIFFFVEKPRSTSIIIVSVFLHCISNMLCWNQK